MATTTEPVLRRKFQYTDLADNSNKWWQVEFWADGTYKATYGRVGYTSQPDIKKGMTMGFVDGKIHEKLQKGYVEIELHVPTSVQTVVADGKTLDPRVNTFVSYVLQEAGQHIKTYLSVGVDALSKSQLARGRQCLQSIQGAALYQSNGKLYPAVVDLVQHYLNTIPTQLPARIDLHQVVMDFLGDLHEQEDRLLQLEAALASYQAAGTGATVTASLGGIQLTPLEQNSAAYGAIADYIARTSGGRRRIHEIFATLIPGERAAWDKETFGKTGIASLFHGTRSPNVHHIMRSGLIIPGTAANGSRFGRGIYFANMAKRSLNYCDSKGPLNILFVNDVALGNPKKLKNDDSSLRQAPTGYSSVWGIESYSGMDEFIVYRPSQQTIRAIVTIE